jgi:hypothetical protein
LSQLRQICANTSLARSLARSDQRWTALPPTLMALVPSSGHVFSRTGSLVSSLMRLLSTLASSTCIVQANRSIRQWRFAQFFLKFNAKRKNAVGSQVHHITSHHITSHMWMNCSVCEFATPKMEKSREIFTCGLNRSIRKSQKPQSHRNSTGSCLSQCQKSREVSDRTCKTQISQG